MIYQPILIQTRKGLGEVVKTASAKYKISVAPSAVRVIEKNEAKSSIGIKEVSEVVGWAALKSIEPRLFVIRNAELLTTEAQNSLLKVLEEPSPNSIIVLQTTNADSLLSTIQSRAVSVIEGGNQEVAKLAKEYTSSTQFLDRTRIKKEILKSAEAKQIIIQICYILLELIKNKELHFESATRTKDMIELLEQGIIAMKRNVSKALVLDTISLYLNLYSA